MSALNRSLPLLPIKLRTNRDHFRAIVSIVPLRAQRQTSSCIILCRGIVATLCRTYPDKYYGFCSKLCWRLEILIVDLGSENFDKVVEDNRVVLIDFWAEWCGYCKLMDPIVEQVALKYRDRILVGRVNADENLAVASRFGLGGLPVFMIFSDGQPVCSLLGAVPRQKFESWVDECLQRNLGHMDEGTFVGQRS
jgi:thioredoxin 1